VVAAIDPFSNVFTVINVRATTDLHFASRAKDSKKTSAEIARMLRAPSGVLGASAASSNSAAASTMSFEFEFPPNFDADLLMALDDEGNSVMSWWDFSLTEDTDSSAYVHNQYFDIGTPIEKFFMDQMTGVLTLFHGKVVDFCTETGWYYILFEDGDTAEFDYDEVVAHLRNI